VLILLLRTAIRANRALNYQLKLVRKVTLQLITKELNKYAQSTSFVIFVVWLLGNGVAAFVFVGFEAKRPVGHVLRMVYKTIQTVFKAGRISLLKR